MSTNETHVVDHYSPVAKFLHWMILLLVVLQFVTAEIMPEITRNQTPGFILSIHMSFGLVIIVLMIVRFFWRMTHPIPPEDETLPKWQLLSARLTHAALYGLLILVPLFGWAWASSRGWPVKVFDLYTMPSLLADGSAWGRLAGLLHSGTATLLLLLVGLHIAAVAYHRYILEDNVLQSMMPKRKNT